MSTLMPTYKEMEMWELSDEEWAKFVRTVAYTDGADFYDGPFYLKMFYNSPFSRADDIIGDMHAGKHKFRKFNPTLNIPKRYV